MKLTTVGLLLALLPGVSCAQSAEAPASVAVPPAPGTPEPIPAPAPAAATPVVVRIEILEEISSARNKRGDTFALQLADAVTLPDGRVLPAGTHGQGEVIHADKSGVGGKPGELILAARFLEVPEGRLRLHALRLSGAGKAHNGAAVGASVVAEAVVPGAGLLALFIHGGQYVIPAGTRGTAKLDVLPLQVVDPNRADSGVSTPKENAQ